MAKNELIQCFFVFLPLYQHQIKRLYHILINHAKSKQFIFFEEKYEQISFYFPKICSFKLTDIFLIRK